MLPLKALGGGGTDLSWPLPAFGGSRQPCNPLQEATVYQALQCFADRLSCLSLKKKTTLCTYTCARARSVSVSLWKERKPAVPWPAVLPPGGCPVSMVLPPVPLPIHTLLEKVEGTQMCPVTADALTSPLNPEVQQRPPVLRAQAAHRALGCAPPPDSTPWGQGRGSPYSEPQALGLCCGLSPSPRFSAVPPRPPLFGVGSNGRLFQPNPPERRTPRCTSGTSGNRQDGARDR